MRHKEQVDIAAPADRVWSIVEDVERWSEWTASIRDVEPQAPGPLALGSRYRVRQPKLPAAVWEVTELEPGRSFTWTSRSPGLKTTAVHALADHEGGTKVTLGIEQSGPLAFLALPFASLTRRYVAMEAAGLKRRAEQS